MKPLNTPLTPKTPLHPDAALLDAADGPMLVAVAMAEATPRVTPSHRHGRGQLFGAVQGLLSVGVEMQVREGTAQSAGQWVVPASHALWVPPQHAHSLHSHGAFHGWSVYIAEDACAALPQQPCLLRTSGLLREAVARAATWDAAPTASLNAAQQRIAQVVMDEICTLPHEAFGLPMPRDARLLRLARALADAPGDTRSLQAWGNQIAMAPRTLTRRFAAETGFSFSEWRQRARLMRALELLAARTPVTTVALELGYDNVSAFIAMFRRTMGTTPSQYFQPP